VGAKFHTLDTVLSEVQRLYSTHSTTTSALPQDIDLLSEDLAVAALALLRRRGGVFEVVPKDLRSSALLREALKVRIFGLFMCFVP